jgi:hypothetical protein
MALRANRKTINSSANNKLVIATVITLANPHVARKPPVNS